ncbi:hypothetical protein VP01_1216g1 [Puccinia sorghi]|uniref:Uncharacterized protein n=1 Tax=Puccinia sorghi TaxID=27349 RepID=A0A0L6VQ82_9BASI|nr:hypothetical protein VP01_1216g1 [Puccinia sorghi]
MKAPIAAGNNTPCGLSADAPTCALVGFVSMTRFSPEIVNDLSIHCMAQHSMWCQSTKLLNCSRMDNSNHLEFPNSTSRFKFVSISLQSLLQSVQAQIYTNNVSIPQIKKITSLWQTSCEINCQSNHSSISTLILCHPTPPSSTKALCTMFNLPNPTTSCSRGNNACNQDSMVILLTFNSLTLGAALSSRMTRSYFATNFGLHSRCTLIAHLHFRDDTCPHEPDMTTILHILEPLVDELLLLNTGVFQKTPNFPNGCRISIHLGALIGDIVASYKIAGFASLSANFFCLCRKQLEKQRQAVLLRETSTLAEKTQMLKQYGTCSSELNNLPYCDPVKNVALGVMHNWYEGVLQHHWHLCWAFEPKLTQHDAHNDQLENVEEYDLDKSSYSCHLQDTALLHIRKVITNIFFPLGVTQVSPNLGNTKNGKLKATEWHSLGPSSGQAKRCFSTSPWWLYIETAKDVFKWPKVTPNHHYALHLPDQLQW